MSNWISVEEKLPATNKTVIAYTDRERYAQVIFAKLISPSSRNWRNANESGYTEPGQVTHWMPLPLPPMREEMTNEASKETD